MNSINFETFKKIILQFYPNEDINFINLIFQEKDNLTFLQELEKYFKNISDFSDTEPKNKFYGVQYFIKLPKSKKEKNIIELNKLIH